MVLGKFFAKTGCGCFVEGTQVLTDDGHKQIELIKKGDKVWAYDAKSGKLALKAVTHTFAVVRDTIYAITIGQQIIRASSDHPFFIGGKWLKVKNLKVGQKVKLYNGTLVPITAIEIVFEPTKVYNFTVANFHTYYVSKNDVLVHNNNCNLNSNAAKGNFGTYKIEVDKVVHKYGKADLNRVTQSTGLPTRLHQQLRILRGLPENQGKRVSGKLIEGLETTTTGAAKKVETATIQAHFDQTGIIPPGNVKSFRPQ